MPMSSLRNLVLSALLVALASGCATTLAPPFNAMTSAPITIYRLQNYEPPPAPASAPAPIGGLQLPPQIQQWIDAGAHMLPPGLIPPGLLPGSAPAPAAATPDVPRFHGFRILGWMALNDPKQHDEVLDILGHDANFVVQHDNCMYAEFGFSIAQPNQPPADVLVSLSCDQAVAASGLAWPYTKTGISADTAKRIVAVVQKAFGGG
jgi:hypothetical protein